MSHSLTPSLTWRLSLSAISPLFLGRLGHFLRFCHLEYNDEVLSDGFMEHSRVFRGGGWIFSELECWAYFFDEIINLKKKSLDLSFFIFSLYLFNRVRLSLSPWTEGTEVGTQRHACRPSHTYTHILIHTNTHTHTILCFSHAVIRIIIGGGC